MKRSSWLIALSVLSLMLLACGSDEPDEPDDLTSTQPLDPELEQRIAIQVAQLNDPSVEVRRQAATALAELNHPATVPGLMKALSDENQEIVEIATAGLVKLGAPAIPTLARVLRDDNSGIQDEAADVLVEMGAVAVGGLLKELSALFRQSGVGDETVEAFSDSVIDVIDEIGEEAIGALVNALDDDDSLVRVLAAARLYLIDESKQQLAQQVVENALAAADAMARVLAAAFLYTIDDSKQALAKATVQKALNDENDVVRVSAGLVLYELDPSKVDEILAVLREIDTPQAQKARQRLEQLNRNAQRTQLIATSPAAGATIPQDAVLTLTFDKPPAQVTVNGTPATLVGTMATWQLQGPARGRVSFVVAWTNPDGSFDSATLQMTVQEKDNRPPDIVFSTVDNGEQDVAPEDIGDVFEVVFNEEVVRGTATIAVEGGANLNWLATWEARKVTLERGAAGAAIGNETTYVVTITTRDTAGNELDTTITFVTALKDQG